MSDLKGVVTTPPEAITGMPKQVLKQIGYTQKDLEALRDTYCETLEDYRKHPIEKIAVSFTQEMRFKRIDGTIFHAKKGVQYIITLPEVAKLVSDSRILSIMNFSSDIKDNFRPYNGQDLNYKSLLVWMDGGIGDTLFYKAIIDSIKKKFPYCTVNVAAAGWFHPMLKHWGTFNKIYSIPFTFAAFNKHDYHLNFDGVIVRVRDAEKTNVYEHLIKWINLDLPLEEMVPFQKPIFSCIKKAKNRLRKWGHLNDFIIVNTSSRSKVRTMGAEATVRLYNSLIELDYNICLIDSRKRYEYHDSLIKFVDKPDRMFNYCREIESLNDSVAVISLAKMMVSVDTANTHLAASLGVPIFGICGPFEGFLRLKTYPNTMWIDNPCELGACHSHAVGEYGCINAADHGYPKCYDALDMKEVAKQIAGYSTGKRQGS